jgi:hypothetical protein
MHPGTPNVLPTFKTPDKINKNGTSDCLKMSCNSENSINKGFQAAIVIKESHKIG